MMRRRLTTAQNTPAGWFGTVLSLLFHDRQLDRCLGERKPDTHSIYSQSASDEFKPAAVNLFTALISVTMTNILLAKTSMREIRLKARTTFRPMK